MRRRRRTLRDRQSVTDSKNPTRFQSGEPSYRAPDRLDRLEAAAEVIQSAIDEERAKLTNQPSPPPIRDWHFDIAAVLDDLQSTPAPSRPGPGVSERSPKA